MGDGNFKGKNNEYMRKPCLTETHKLSYRKARKDENSNCEFYGQLFAKHKKLKTIFSED